MRPAASRGPAVPPRPAWPRLPGAGAAGGRAPPAAPRDQPPPWDAPAEPRRTGRAARRPGFGPHRRSPAPRALSALPRPGREIPAGSPPPGNGPHGCHRAAASMALGRGGRSSSPSRMDPANVTGCCHGSAVLTSERLKRQRAGGPSTGARLPAVPWAGGVRPGSLGRVRCGGAAEPVEASCESSRAWQHQTPSGETVPEWWRRPRCRITECRRARGGGSRWAEGRQHLESSAPRSRQWRGLRACPMVWSTGQRKGWPRTRHPWVCLPFPVQCSNCHQIAEQQSQPT